MKKKLFAAGCAALLLLCGCQKTPDKEAVVSKAGGLKEGTAAEALSDGEKRRVELPSQWEKTEEKKEGQVTISADLSLESPEIQNTPVIEMKNREFTEEDLKKLVEYFAGEEKVYEPREKTKEELEAMKSRIDKREGAFGDLAKAAYYKTLSSNLEKMIEEAPESPAPLKESQTVFDIEKSKLWIQSRAYFGIQEEIGTEKNIYRASVGENAEAEIRAFSYNEKAGSTSNFSYKRGTVWSETSIRDQEENNESSLVLEGENGYYATAYRPQLEALKTAMDKEGITQEQGKERAEALLKDLEIQGMAMFSSEKGVWLAKEDLRDSFDSIDSLWDFDQSKAKSGYLYKFTKEIQGLLADYRPGADYDTPEDSYAPPFGVETIEIFVTEEGVQSFEWSNMAEEAGYVAENTNLLSFEEIADRLFEHLFYVVASESTGQNGEGEAAYTYTVQEVKLGYTYAPAYEKPEDAWLVPAWFFTVRKSVETGGNQWQTPTEYVMINALDGGYISPNYAVIGGQNR